MLIDRQSHVKKRSRVWEGLDPIIAVILIANESKFFQLY